MASLLIGSWLGPEPGFNQGICSNGTTEYTFNSDGTWFAHMVNYTECGGTFTIGGSYSLGQGVIGFHYTLCPETCALFPDSTQSLSFIDANDFSLSDASFSGTYHRQ